MASFSRPPRSSSQKLNRAQTMMVDLPNEENFAADSELVPSSLASIASQMKSRRITPEWPINKGNIANQREHLILLLANMDVRKILKIIYSGGTYQTAAPDEETFLRNVITPIYQVLRKVQEVFPVGVANGP